MLDATSHRHFKRHWIIIAACLALFGGVALARQWQLTDARWLWMLVPCVLLGVRRHSWLLLISLSMLLAGVGMWRGSLYKQKLQVYDDWKEQTVTVIGRATEDGVYGKRYQLTFGMNHAQIIAPEQVPLIGNLNIGGFGATAVYRGDVVEATGRLYKTRGNAQAGISFAQLRVRERHPSWINDLRRSFAAGMQSALPEPLASFGLGLLIGQRNTLPPEISHMLLVVGLTHIIAVSGYNLTIILRAMQRLLGKRSKFQVTASCLLLTAVFLLLTGNSPSIVRASIISVLGLAAWYYGRRIKPLVLLLLAAAITVYANPLYLWGNVSWYLSFLAFFGVLVVAPLFTKRLYGARQPRLLTQIVIESLSAELMTLPYVLFIFGQMSLVALPANILIVALVPLGMLLALVAGVGGMLVPALVGWIAWPARLLLEYMLSTASLLSRIPHAFATHISFSAVTMFFVYALIGFLAAILWHKTTKTVTITDKEEGAGT